MNIHFGGPVTALLFFHEDRVFDSPLAGLLSWDSSGLGRIGFGATLGGIFLTVGGDGFWKANPDAPPNCCISPTSLPLGDFGSLSAADCVPNLLYRLDSFGLIPLSRGFIPLSVFVGLSHPLGCKALFKAFDEADTSISFSLESKPFFSAFKEWVPIVWIVFGDVPLSAFTDMDSVGWATTLTGTALNTWWLSLCPVRGAARARSLAAVARLSICTMKLCLRASTISCTLSDLDISEITYKQIHVRCTVCIAKAFKKCLS